MTTNNIAFPLSSVATNISLEKVSSNKNSGEPNSFQTVLDGFVTPSNTDDKPVQHDASSSPKENLNDSSQISEIKSKDESDHTETSKIEKTDANTSAEPVEVVPPPTLILLANKKELIAEISEEQVQSQSADSESISLQDEPNLQAPLINIIAAQTFNNKLAQQEKTITSTTETAPTNSVIASAGSETLNKLNSPTETNGEAFAAQLSPKIAVENKANADLMKLNNTSIEIQSADQTKLVNTINAIDTPLPIANQSQTNTQINTVNSINQSLPSYAVPNNFYSDNWNSSVHQQVLLLRHNNIDNATLVLNPEHLGPIHVSIQIDAQSQTSIQFWSQNPDVRQALRDGLHNLNTLFQDSGLQLGSTDVSSQQNSFSDNNNPKQSQANKQSGLSSDDLNPDNQVDTPFTVTNLVNVYI
jgi:flagellar hook-length control protein FliK